DVCFCSSRSVLRVSAPSGGKSKLVKKPPAGAGISIPPDNVILKISIPPGNGLFGDDFGVICGPHGSGVAVRKPPKPAGAEYRRNESPKRYSPHEFCDNCLQRKAKPFPRGPSRRSCAAFGSGN